MRGADGDQPFGSLTIRTSVAAGPHRSRTSLSAMSPVRLVAIFSWSALCFLTGCGTLARMAPVPALYRLCGRSRGTRRKSVRLTKRETTDPKRLVESVTEVVTP